MSEIPLSTAADAVAAAPAIERSEDTRRDEDGQPSKNPLVAIRLEAEIAAKTSQFREALKQAARSYFQLANLPEIIDGIDLDAIILYAVAQCINENGSPEHSDLTADDEIHIFSHPLFKPTLEKLLGIFITNAKAASEGKDALIVLKYITLAAAIIPFTTTAITKEFSDLYRYIFNRRLEVEGLLDLFIRAKRVLKAVTYISDETLHAKKVSYPDSYKEIDITKKEHEALPIGTLIRYALEAEREADITADENERLAILEKAIVFRAAALNQDPNDMRTRDRLIRDLELVGRHTEAVQIRRPAARLPGREPPVATTVNQDDLRGMRTPQLIGISNELEDLLRRTSSQDEAKAILERIIYINEEIAAREPENILANCVVVKSLLELDRLEEAMPFIERVRALRAKGKAIPQNMERHADDMERYLIRANLRRLLRRLPVLDANQTQQETMDISGLIEQAKSADANSNSPRIIRIQAAILSKNPFNITSRIMMSKALAELGYIEEAIMLSEQVGLIEIRPEGKKDSGDAVGRLKKMLGAKKCAHALIDALVQSGLMRPAERPNLKDIPDFKEPSGTPKDYRKAEEPFNPAEYNMQALVTLVQQARAYEDINMYFKCQYELLSRQGHRFITYTSIAHFLFDKGFSELCMRVCELIEELKPILSPYEHEYDIRIHKLYERVGFDPTPAGL